MALEIAPISLRDACAFVARVHRHHRAPQGGKFAIAAEESGELRGVVIVGRPVSRTLDDGRTAEVVRLATDGARNACSLLYAAAWRTAKGMGYRRLVTYILAPWRIELTEDECRMVDDGCPHTEPLSGGEDGASLRASNWRCVGEAGGGSWSRPSRGRTDSHPTVAKTRWEAA